MVLASYSLPCSYLALKLTKHCLEREINLLPRAFARNLPITFKKFLKVFWSACCKCLRYSCVKVRSIGKKKTALEDYLY